MEVSIQRKTTILANDRQSQRKEGCSAHYLNIGRATTTFGAKVGHIVTDQYLHHFNLGIHPSANYILKA